MDVERRVRATYARLTAGSGDSPLLQPVIAAGRWMVVFYRKLDEHQAFIRAGSMAYATLVGLVPLLLLIFGVLEAVAPGEESRVLENILFSTFLGDMPEVRDVLLPGLRSVDLGTMGVLGTVGLLAIAGNLYLTAERAYSHVFEADEHRSMLRRLLNFYVVLTAVPVVSAVVALSTVQMASEVGAPWMRTALGFLLPWVLLVGALKLLPAAEVRWGPAFAGGTTSAVLLQLATVGFGKYIELFASDNPIQLIYGSLALVPLFFGWLFLLWIAVLLGVEVAYVVQCFRSLVSEEEAQRERREGRARHPAVGDALAVLAVLARAFEEGEGGLTEQQLAERSGRRQHDVHSILAVYLREGPVGRLEEGALVLLRPPARLAVSDLAATWHASTSLAPEDPAVEEITARLHVLEGSLEHAASRWQEEAEEQAASA